MAADGGLSEEVWRRVQRSAIRALVPLGALVGVYYALWLPLPDSSGSRALSVAANLALVGIYSAAILTLGRWRLRKWLAEALRWVDEERLPADSELRGIVGIAGRAAREAFGAMLVVAVLTGVENVVGGSSGLQWLRVVVGLALLALTVACLTYLLVEAAMRPVFRLALPLRAGAVASLPVRSRLLITWAVGSAIPVLFMMAILLRGKGRRLLPIGVPIEFMGLSALTIGAVSQLAVARSIADPLKEIQHGLREVAEGQLEVEIPIDDPGEIGLVQASFNGMVVGLRERKAIEDLFGRHVGIEVMRHAIDQGVHLGGELRDATALFTDLIGSTSLGRRLPPQEVVKLLNVFFAEVSAIVEAHGGWINKFEGDAALCLFGVPADLPDHPDHALAAARELRGRLISLRERYPDLDAAIGMSTGEVVAGNVGTEHRFEYTVIGDAVNEAARVTELAKQDPGRVAATGRTVARAAREQPYWVARGSVTLRGRDDPTEVFVPIDNRGLC